MKSLVSRSLMVSFLLLAQGSLWACPCALNEKKASLEEQITQAGEVYAEQPTDENLAKLAALNKELESVLEQLENS